MATARRSSLLKDAPRRERRARRPARRPAARERELDALLVSDLVNVRYLTGFTGTNGLCLVGPDKRLFLTDFRYVAQAEEQVQDFDRVQGKQDLLGEAAAHMSGRVGFDDADLSVRRHQRLRGSRARWRGARAGRRARGGAARA